MVLIKYLGLFSVFMLCSYIGFLKSRAFEERVIELNKFQSALIMFESKLKFTYEPIKNIFEEISKVIYKDENNVFLYTSKEEKNINKAWNDGIDSNKNLSNDDKVAMKTMGKLLGKTDLDGQLSEISLELELLNKQIKEAECEKNRNVKLYRTMGIICGLGICIILI